MINNPLFPVWQPDEQEYNAICQYLNVSPKAHLYEKLSNYLVKAPFSYPQAKGFALYLAKPRLSLFRIARLDLLSKLLYKSHPIRYILNAMIALYECDGEGYTEISAAPEGQRLLFSLAGWGLGFGISLIVTLFWLAWQYLNYIISLPFNSEQDLTGKTIFITGVSRGLGLEILLYSLQQGAAVIGTVRNQAAYDELLAQLPEQAPLKLIIVDLGKKNQIQPILETNKIQLESIDIAVLSAGTKFSGTSVLSIDSIRDTFEVNLFSNIELCQYLCHSEHKTAIVLVSSIGRFHGMHSSAGYNASKAALSIWGESLDMELNVNNKKNVSVMIVEPGMFESGMMNKTASSGFLYASRYELAVKIISGALSGQKTLRFPYWFALLTWGICLGGRGIKNRIFARASQSINKVD